MSSGGMEWAYRIVQANALDPLAKLVVLHLGWRDHANQRTDKGIARALGLHRTSVRRVTASLAEKGVIARRSGQWVACETISIVDQKSDAPRPDKASADKGAHEVPPCKGGAHEVPPEGHMRCPQQGTSGAPKRKEKIDKARGRAAPAKRKPGRSSVLGALAAVPSRVEGKRRLYQGPDGNWYHRPDDPRESEVFERWLTAGRPAADASHKVRA